jgi:SagB-type dehydrogenase family enzyme
MKTQGFRLAGLICVLTLICPSLAFSQQLQPIQLPDPQTDGGKPLMQALKERKSAREFSTQTLPPQVLSNLLWAACGINRPSGRRTAPSSTGRHEIDIYVASSEGLYLWDPKMNILKPVLAEDIRALTGRQDFVKTAAVNLIYVVDLIRGKRLTLWKTPEERELNSGADTGFISQNVYLYCASEGLSTVVRGNVDREALAKAMGLEEGHRVVLAQSVGYPKQ